MKMKLKEKSKPQISKKKGKLKVSDLQKASQGLYDVAVPEAGDTGNVLTSGLEMAGTGATVAGPWGAAAGLVAGVGLGIMQENAKDKLNKAAIQRNAENKINRSYDGMDETINQKAQAYKKGTGKMKKAKLIEAEGKEHHFDEDLNHKGKIKGNSHAKGGEIITVEEGDSIIPKKHEKTVDKALKKGDFKTIDNIRKKLPKDEGKNHAEEGIPYVDPNAYRKRNSKLKVASFDDKPLFADDANRKGRYGDYEGAVKGLDAGTNSWLGQGEKGNPYPYGVISVPNPTAKNGFTMYRHDDMPKLKPKNSLESDFTSPSIPDKLTGVPTNPLASPTPGVPEAAGEAAGQVGSVLKYANLANNVIRSFQKPKPIEQSYLDPELLKYQDRSESLRKASRMGETIQGNNARNVSGGNASNVRSNQAAASVDNLNRQDQINEVEMGRADQIDATNVQIKNRAKEVNLGRKDQYQDQMQRATASQEAYQNAAMKGIADHASINEKMRYERSRDTKLDALELKRMNYINQYTKYKGDGEGSIDFKGEGPSGSSLVPDTTTVKTINAKGQESTRTTTKSPTMRSKTGSNFKRRK